MQDFIKKAQIEAKRGEHWAVNALDYKIYDKACSLNPNIALYHEGSVKYRNTRQLLKLRMMESPPKFNNYLTAFNFNFEKLFVQSE